jgi:hypothetical protein
VVTVALELSATVLCLVLAFERATKAWDRLRRLKRERIYNESEAQSVLHVGFGDGLD